MLNRGFYGFFGDFRLRLPFQEQIAPKPIEIDKNKLRMKFSALNVDFNGPTLDFLGSRKTAHKGIKEQYPHKKSLFYCSWPVFRKNGCRQAWTCCLSQQALVMSFSVVSTLMTLKDPELPKYGVFTNFLRSLAAAHTPRMNCDEMAGDRLTVCEQELLQAFARS